MDDRFCTRGREKSNENNMKDNCQLDVLCLCSSQTTQMISEFPFVRDVHRTRTIDETLRVLRTDRFDVFVVSLDGDDPNDGASMNQLLGAETTNNDRYDSKLLNEAYYYSPAMMRIAYSETSAVPAQLKEACFSYGADAVLDSPNELQTSLQEFFSNPVPNNNENEFDYTDADEVQIVSNCSRLLSLAPSLRKSREDALLRISSDHSTHRIQQTRDWRLRHEKQIQQVNLRLRQEQQQKEEAEGDDRSQKIVSPGEVTRTTTIRVVHMSDTHNLHDLASSSIPKGDIFLHTGDICANYDAQRNLRADLQEFFQWLEDEICPKFDKIVLIGGNHDVILDEDHPRFDRAAWNLIRNFQNDHAGFSYLKDESTTYRGLVIYGSPTCVSRVETMDLSYLSNGFERWLEDRRSLWERIPKDTDILLTHCPPGGILEEVGGDNGKGACRLLAKAVYRRSNEDENEYNGFRPPLLHAFGHVHSTHGVGFVNNASARSGSTKAGTILSNGCQASILEDDPFGGGSPIVIDLVADSTRDSHRRRRRIG